MLWLGVNDLFGEILEFPKMKDWRWMTRPTLVLAFFKLFRQIHGKTVPSEYPGKRMFVRDCFLSHG
jgi:hypothetical protein